MVKGNSAADLRRWTANADPAWLRGINVVATDLTESFRAGLSPHLEHARRVADPFHVVRVGNRCLDRVRRRVQNETLGHRGRKHDPLYRIRKILLTGNEGLDDRCADRKQRGADKLDREVIQRTQYLQRADEIQSGRGNDRDDTKREESISYRRRRCRGRQPPRQTGTPAMQHGAHTERDGKQG
jgi:transposase